MKTEQQNKFLQLALIEGKTYAQIEEILGIPRKEFAPWWEELKEVGKVFREIWEERLKM